MPEGLRDDPYHWTELPSLNKDYYYYHFHYPAGLEPGITCLRDRCFNHLFIPFHYEYHNSHLIRSRMTMLLEMFTFTTGELGYDGPLYNRLLSMTYNMLGLSPTHIKYVSYVYDGLCIYAKSVIYDRPIFLVPLSLSYPSSPV